MRIKKELGAILLSGLVACGIDEDSLYARDVIGTVVEDNADKIDVISEARDRAMSVIEQGLSDGKEATERLELERNAYINLFREREEILNTGNFLSHYRRANGSFHSEVFSLPPNPIILDEQEEDSDNSQVNFYRAPDSFQGELAVLGIPMSHEEFTRYQAAALRQIHNFDALSSIAPGLREYNTPDNIRAWRRHASNINPLHRRTRDIARIILRKIEESNIEMNPQLFVESLEEGRAMIQAHYPSENVNPVSFRRFANLSGNMLLTIMICESTGPNYTPEGRIEYFRMMINSGYNPYQMVTNTLGSLDTGAFQNTPTSTNGNQLSLYWNTSDDYRRNRDSEIVNPYTDFNFPDIVLDTNLQHIITGGKIIQGLHGVGGRLYRNSPENFRRLISEYENLTLAERTNIDVVFTAIAHNTVMVKESDYNSWSELIFENRHKSLLEIQEEILRNNDFARSALEVYNSLVSNADL